MEDPVQQLLVTFAELELDDGRPTGSSNGNSDTVPNSDSAIGDSLGSKWSSLDRRSQISDGPPDAEQHLTLSSFRSDFTCIETVSDVLEEKSNTKRKPILPSISFPRKLFSRDRVTVTHRGVCTPINGTIKINFMDKKHGANDDICISTTGLILEKRPRNLPSKAINEETKHRAEYDEILSQTKKKEVRKAKERKRALQLQRKFEERVSSSCREWCNVILPKWNEMKNTKRCRELWWHGLPPKVRGSIWLLIIGNELNLTQDLYEICCTRAQQKVANISKTVKGSYVGTSENPALNLHVNREDTIELIHLDLSRTFPNLGIFQKDGPYYELLFNLLGAYACYRPDIGYVQSMSFVAAILLLQMGHGDAFIAFSNLLNQPLQVSFFRLQQPEMTIYFIAYDQYFDQELHQLYSHFDELDVRPDLYLIEWLYTLYAKSLPLEVTCRVWDMFFRDGEEFLFKTALGILHLYEVQLIQMDFDEVVHFLTHLPEDMEVFDLFISIKPFMHNKTDLTRSRQRRQGFMEIYENVKQRINRGSKPFADIPSTMLSRDKSVNSISNCLNLSRVSKNMQDMKMSKSLCGFLDDLLNAPTSEKSAPVRSQSFISQ